MALSFDVEPCGGVRPVFMKHNPAISSRHRPPSPSPTTSCTCTFRCMKGKEAWPRVGTCWEQSNPQVGLRPSVSLWHWCGTLDASVAELNKGTGTRTLSPMTETSLVQMTVSSMGQGTEAYRAPDENQTRFQELAGIPGIPCDSKSWRQENLRANIAAEDNRRFLLPSVWGSPVDWMEIWLQRRGNMTSSSSNLGATTRQAMLECWWHTRQNGWGPGLPSLLGELSYGGALVRTVEQGVYSILSEEDIWWTSVQQVLGSWTTTVISWALLVLEYWPHV